MGLLDQQVPHPNDRDTVNLTAAELRAIADAVESLAQVRGSTNTPRRSTSEPSRANP